MSKVDGLKAEIISMLKEQGFKVDSRLEPKNNTKKLLRNLQKKSKLEQIQKRSGFIRRYQEKMQKYLRDGHDINPNEINLELRLINSGSFEETLFKWWNLVWWSIPYQRPVGRQMRYLLWDKTHEAPFGIIGLQSPILKMSIRDKKLNLPKEDLDIWVNKSLKAQRVGALPPYNQLIGGKMVALALTANEIRSDYYEKYKNRTTIMEERKIKPTLLWISTTSAFGRSSIYNRLKFYEEDVAISLGYTKGAGSFHVPDTIYKKILKLLEENEIDISRGYGHGPSRKLKLISTGFELLGLEDFQYHHLKREYFLFPLVRNLMEVVHEGEESVHYNRPFESLVHFWKERWGIPRSERFNNWKKFDSEKYIDQKLRELGVA